MNKKFLVILLQKDIHELSLLTEGFEKMTELPEPILRLAIQKAENILESLNTLGNFSQFELGNFLTWHLQDGFDRRGGVDRHRARKTAARGPHGGHPAGQGAALYA